MRVLFACTPGAGHFLPLLPLAQACADAGHDVAFASGPNVAERMRGAGFEFLEVGPPLAELEGLHAPDRARLLEIPAPERRPFAFAWRFGKIDAPRRVDDLMNAVHSWSPDVVVHESADLAAPIVAGALAVPTAHHAFGRVVPLPCWERAAEEVAPLWRAAGLEPDPLCGAFAGLYLDICPPSFQTSAFPPGARVELVRPAWSAAVAEEPPAWLANLGERPTVYVTLGTVFNEAVVFRLVLDALADEECTVVATIGAENDPAALGPLPENAIVERYVSQSLLLPHCDGAVGHGGSGSTLAALAHGLPLLLLPRGADQFENAAACAELGVARVLHPEAVTAEAVRGSVRALLDDDTYRRRAEALAAEIEAMPAPADVVPKLATAA